MNNENEEQEDEPFIEVSNGQRIIIPKCCRDGRDDCKHVVQRERRERKNIAL